MGFDLFQGESLTYHLPYLPCLLRTSLATSSTHLPIALLSSTAATGIAPRLRGEDHAAVASHIRIVAADQVRVVAVTTGIVVRDVFIHYVFAEIEAYLDFGRVLAFLVFLCMTGRDE